MKLVSALLGGLLIAGAGPLLSGAEPAGVPFAVSCESLMSFKRPNTTVTMAQLVGAGEFVAPGARGGAGQRMAALPAFCRVTASLTPSADSDIKVEVWMPSSGWNGRFQAVGNGGWAGSVSYAALGAALSAGYATAATDTGHTGGTAAFALGHPEKYVDMGYRAVHEMSAAAKAVVDAFYGGAPKLSLWNGCSQGGRQGITEAERYPSDFDAIIAGAPSVYQMELHALRVGINVMTHRTADSAIPSSKYSAVHDAVLNACDAIDGVKDGVLEDPTACRFDPKTIECQGADGPSCLTAAQVETARALYSPIKHPKTGAAISPALLTPGTELGWATLAGPQPLDLSVSAFQYVVFKDPAWDWHRFNAATDVDLAIKADAGVMNFTDPNLAPFFNRGGKLLLYHGWSDPQVAPLNTVRYFQDVVKTAGAAAAGRSIQLYMVPGMGHCQGGPGPNSFDKVAAMDQWISQGRAPAEIVASHRTGGQVDRTRPLCPYGQVAKWKGAGSTDEAASFSCVAR
jgi:Tannase and feruloyl esterase